jgi:inosine-uridine nucleoside N-ribohydrolase
MLTRVCIAICGLAAAGCAQLPLPPAPSTPQPVIIDTDVGYDIDDAMALAIAFRAQKLGYLDIKAITTITGNGLDSAPSFVNTMLAYGGYTTSQIPIGAQQTNTGGCGADDNYAGQTVNALQLTPNQPRSAFPAAVSVLRQTLAAAPDGSIMLITLGPLTNIAQLMQSPADRSSNMTGAALFAAKVSSLVAMGGAFPTNPADYNWRCDATSAAYVFANNGQVPIVAVGGEVADSINIGGLYATNLPANSPIAKAIPFFISHGGGFSSGSANSGRTGWDPSAVFFGIAGTRAASGGPYYKLSPSGTTTITVNPESNAWVASPASNHYYVMKVRPYTDLGAILNSMLYEDYAPSSDYPRRPPVRKKDR